ncbi:MAG: GIY-YIG nuclease family protein [Pseudonocardia sp.]|nr:GIY-YIG nuclease family protein [Pseudonocardia sp.]
MSETGTATPTAGGASDLLGEVNLGATAEADEVPPVPAQLGADLAPSPRQQLHKLLWNAPGQLGDVYRAIVQLPSAGPTELRPLTNCANPGVVGNRRAVVYAIMNRVERTGATVARQAASTVRQLQKSATDDDVRGHLVDVLQVLEGKASSPEAVAQEADELESGSAHLADVLKHATGVYVYTYPHYWRHPYVPGTERRLLKVGRTTNQAWTRVLAQARQTGMPEDPLLLRVYKSNHPAKLEKSFHMLLDAAEHVRSSGTAVGREWFTTTLEYCDAIATALDVEVLKGGAEPP